MFDFLPDFDPAGFWTACTLLLITSGYEYHRQPWVPRRAMAATISDRIYRFCTAPTSISSELTKNPSGEPAHLAEVLYGGQHFAITEHKSRTRQPASAAELQRVRQCGNWGDSDPSELFLQCYHAALCSLEHDPLAGMVSPSLMGSSGVLPVTVIAPLPDICRHMANLIVRAEKDVFLATNFWIASGAASIITDAIRELSRRAGERGERIVMKIMYDRGNIKQVVDNHQMMSPKQYTADAVKLPAPEEIPHIDMEVQNFHRPMLGTFHSKFMVVDRRIAVVQSNNIQDNDNLEMMTHVEGAIVNSIYDTALLSWARHLNPPLPSLDTPASNKHISMFHNPAFQALFDENGGLRVHQDSLLNKNLDDSNKDLSLPDRRNRSHDSDIVAEIEHMQAILSPGDGETQMDAVTRHLNLAKKLDRKGTAPQCRSEDDMIPIHPHKAHAPFPMALVNRRPWGAPNHECVNVPQNEAWLAAIRNAQKTVFIQTPNLNASPLVPALKEAARRGIEVTYYVCLGYNDAGELLPFQGGHNEKIANEMYENMSEEHRKNLRVHYYVAKDQIIPIHNKFKTRSCHIKLMIVDDHVGIQGNGNQDTQSWFHSMEVNIMIDSYHICRDWKEQLRRNQNTHLYGLASQEDGIWRDEDGKEVEGAIGKDPGKFPWAKGLVGAVQRVRGAGGF
ncbi:IQ calmodulin-binding domain-containing protein [Didymella exigua CBS 183.55]|uniref:IQ calmodulin-binding domain-containing protein n=1 Tax=Didymella exigua CBS 183.55 TaxID=1150837 RepID=A0A6A5RHD8_9PLEO|nr:IQ calmodulin-binding domain-containing protein [Didymella exigua CBS 183.55]KAF1926504.1 IQ calmodulin-binding domain-containing protein [Didymella exigua CBS 183.55]